MTENVDFVITHLFVSILLICAVLDGALHNQNEITKEDTTPIAVVIPGLTSDSSSPVSLVFNLLSGLGLCFIQYP